jgi:hypothetical protein
MPEPRQAQVRARFAEAQRRLSNAGLLDRLMLPAQASIGELGVLGTEYFQLGLPCPFLEDESCSIHPDRPVACRQYLVTSPAEHCARPTPETVHGVAMPAQVSNALGNIDKRASAVTSSRLPLVLALEWSEAHAEEPPPRAAPAIIKELLSLVANDARSVESPALIVDWIFEDNLRALLIALGWAIGVTVTDKDWRTVAAGVLTSEFASDRWFDHSLAGTRTAKIQLARDAPHRAVQTRIESPAPDQRVVRTIVALCQCFHLSEEMRNLSA